LIPVAEIEAARERIAGAAVRTPLIRLPDTDIWLKLENLQPVSSFKIRGATNAIRAASAEELAGGVVTASAGNMAQGVAWAAREAGVPATIIVPDHAPQTKLDRIEALGGRAIKVPFEQWWQTIVESRFEGLDGLFVHPVRDPLVMAGNGTIGLELLEDLPDVDTVLVPFGGGGLSTGIASAVKALRPSVKVYGVDPEPGPALSSAFAAGEPVTVDYTPSFVDGSGSKGVLEFMWPYLREALDGAFVASLDETADAVRLLAERVRVIAEGAGALAPAVALSGRAGGGKIACIVSGGNIDFSVLSQILAGETPR
jgi:threonine dehydratase